MLRDVFVHLFVEDLQRLLLDNPLLVDRLQSIDLTELAVLQVEHLHAEQRLLGVRTENGVAMEATPTENGDQIEEEHGLSIGRTREM